MALIDVYNASQNADFQGRCLAAAWKTAQLVLDDDPAYDLSAQSKNFALKLLRKQVTVSLEQLAVNVLRNPVIAGDIVNAADNDILYQVTQIWPDLIDIG